MDLQSMLMVLKIEAFLGGNPLMKLNGTKWRLSKIAYALQAFYGTFLIISAALIISRIVQNKFLAYGLHIPQYWGSAVTSVTFFQLLMFVTYIKNITKGRCFSNMLEDLCCIHNVGSKSSLDKKRYKAWIFPMAPQLLIIIVCWYIYITMERHLSAMSVAMLVTNISNSAIYATMTAILLCFKQTYKKINNRLAAMNSKYGLDDSDFARRMSVLGMHYRTLRSAVNRFNDFFGTAIFLQLAFMIFSILAWLCHVILTDFPVNLYRYLIPLKAVFSTIIIMCCDSVLEEAEKSTFISLALSEKLPWSSPKRAAVLSFMETCKDFAPVFSVMGLFRIKRSTILSVFNIISTFMVVLFQSTKFNQQSSTNMEI